MTQRLHHQPPCAVCFLVGNALDPPCFIVCFAPSLQQSNLSLNLSSVAVSWAPGNPVITSPGLSCLLVPLALPLASRLWKTRRAFVAPLLRAVAQSGSNRASCNSGVNCHLSSTDAQRARARFSTALSLIRQELADSASQVRIVRECFFHLATGVQ